MTPPPFPASTTRLTKVNGPWSYMLAGLLAPLVYMYFFGNPLDSFMEAPSCSYYQARMVAQRGSQTQNYLLQAVMSDGKISLKEYEKDVFPAYLHVVRNGESPMPDTEKLKGLSQQKHELLAVLTSPGVPMMIPH